MDLAQWASLGWYGTDVLVGFLLRAEGDQLSVIAVLTGILDEQVNVAGWSGQTHHTAPAPVSRQASIVINTGPKPQFHWRCNKLFFANSEPKLHISPKACTPCVKEMHTQHD